MIEKIKHGLTIQIDDDGQEWINGMPITSWDTLDRPRSKGKFIKGISGNPAGMPKYKENNRALVMKTCLAFSLEGVEILKAFARNERERTPTRIKAIEVIFDRGLGKAQETQSSKLSTGELVDSLPDVFFPGGKRPEVEPE